MCACTLKKEHSWQAFLPGNHNVLCTPPSLPKKFGGLKDEATASISCQQIHDMMYVMHDIMYVMHGSLYGCMYIVHCIVQCK